jgi:hypothetical protein
MADTKITAFATLAAASYLEPVPLTFVVQDSATGQMRQVKVEFLGP